MRREQNCVNGNCGLGSGRDAALARVASGWFCVACGDVSGSGSLRGCEPRRTPTEARNRYSTGPRRESKQCCLAGNGIEFAAGRYRSSNGARGGLGVSSLDGITAIRCRQPRCCELFTAARCADDCCASRELTADGSRVEHRSSAIAPGGVGRFAMFPACPLGATGAAPRIDLYRRPVCLVPSP